MAQGRVGRTVECGTSIGSSVPRQVVSVVRSGAGQRGGGACVCGWGGDYRGASHLWLCGCYQHVALLLREEVGDLEKAGGVAENLDLDSLLWFEESLRS